MSQQHQDSDRHLADFTGIILILTFVVIFAVMSSGSQSLSLMPAAPTNESQEIVAQVVPTNSSEPTSTPVPPTVTATSAPTNTPEATPTAQPSSTPLAAATATEEAVAAAGPIAENAAAYDPALVEQGKMLFTLCSACHGPDGHGIPNLGKDLVTSEFVHSLTDADLLTFIKTGRPIWDPLNTTGIDMPPKGGNPALSDDEIMALIAYIRSLSPTG